MRFDEQGLVPAIIQDVDTGDVLTLAYMNEESLRRTVETSETWFWSRSRNELWHKGATSGNTQNVVSIAADCDQDAVLVNVRPRGPACHKGEKSCFHDYIHQERETKGASASGLGRQLEQLYEVIKDRRQERPAHSYTSQLFDEGLDKILKKVGEESAETIIAAKNEDRQQFVHEVSDLIYHLWVLLVERGVDLSEIRSELASRAQRNDKPA